MTPFERLRLIRDLLACASKFYCVDSAASDFEDGYRDVEAIDFVMHISDLSRYLAGSIFFIDLDILDQVVEYDSLNGDQVRYVVEQMDFNVLLIDYIFQDE